MTEPRRDTNWWGWGDPSAAPSSTRRRSAVLRERIGELEPWPLAARHRGLRAARGASRCRAAVIDAVGADSGLRLATRTGCATPAGAATSTWRGCARGAPRGRARRGAGARPTPAAVGAAARRLRGAGRRRGAVRRRHQRRRRGRAAARRPRGADQPRPRRAARSHRRRRRSLTARLGAGLRGPEAEAALGAAGPHPRPLPAVLRVRDDRRLRRDPLGRPGLERLRPLRLAGHLGPPARPGRRTCARWRPRTPPPGPALRELVIGSEGVLGVIPDVTVRVRPAPPRAPLRGLDRGELRGRHRDRPRPRPGARPADDRPRLRRGGDAGLAGALGAARRRRAGSSAATCGLRSAAAAAR